MSANDPAENKEQEIQPHQATSASGPPPPARAATSMPPPPPRRSAKPSGPPPPPPRLPSGQRLAGIFSTPPPPPVRVAAPAPAAAREPVATKIEAVRPEHPAAAEQPVVATPPAVVAPSVTVAESRAVALAEQATPEIAQETATSVTTTSSPSLAPPLASRSSRPPPLPQGASVPSLRSVSTSALARVAAVQAQLVSTVPPAWIETARARPVLWMVALPVGLATLLILTLLAFQPAEKVSKPSPARASVSAVAVAELAPAAGKPAQQPEGPTLAELEAKPAASLSVDELLVLNEGRAARKRQQAHALSLKLQQDSNLAKDIGVQAELLRLAADPDTAATALAAMAQARSAIGADLLYEAWTSRSLPPATAELARQMLYSRDVRPHASPALAIALDLRSAESCESVRAVLPKAASDGDRRSLPPLAKLNARSGCGEKKAHDCYECLRSQMKPVVTAIAKVKGRRSPRYPATPKL